jgi:hypothetical protein
MALQLIVTEILKEIENSRTECDGFVRLASYLLTKNNIQHEVKVGALRLNTDRTTIPLHFWIEVDDYIIDYRARMWLGNNAPHGVFKRNNDYSYTGDNAKIEPTSELIYNILNW